MAQKHTRRKYKFLSGLFSSLFILTLFVFLSFLSACSSGSSDSSTDDGNGDSTGEEFTISFPSESYSLEINQAITEITPTLDGGTPVLALPVLLCLRVLVSTARAA